MASFNKVILMGNLTRDPELRYAANGTAICKVGMAMNRRIPDPNGGPPREEVTFVDVTIFGKRGEAFQKYHTKGKAAFIEGALRYDTWEDKNGGGKRSKLYVVADNWEFVGSGPGRGSAPDHGGEAGGSFGGTPSEVPQGGGADDTPF